MSSVRTPADLSTLLALIGQAEAAPAAGGGGITAVLAGDGITAATSSAGVVTLQLDLAGYSGLQTAVLGVASAAPGRSSQILKTDAAGRLFLEELVLAGGFSLVDETTGAVYALAVANGRLYLRPI